MPLNPDLRDAQCLAGDPHSSHKTLACVDLGPHTVVSLPPPAPRVSEGTGTTPTLCRKRKPAQRRGARTPFMAMTVRCQSLSCRV